MKIVKVETSGVTTKVTNSVFWRPLSKKAIKSVTRQFSQTCARLMQARIDLVWNNTPDGRTLNFF